MKAYSTYQRTGDRWLESVPSDWEFKRFKYLFEIRKRIAGKLGFDVLSITQKGIKVKDITSGEGQLASDYSKYQIVKFGDFAMNHMDLLTGFVDLSAFEGVTSPDYRVFTLTAKDCSPRFCLYILQMGYTDKVFYPLGQGAAHVGRWRLPTGSFRDFKTPLPSLHEQEKIVKFLDIETLHIDRLIQEKKQFVKLLEEKRLALITRVVTKGLDDTVEMKDSGVEWIGDIPTHWSMPKISYLMEYIGSGTTPDSSNKEYYEGDIPWVTTGELREGLIINTKKKITQKAIMDNSSLKSHPINSIVVAMYGATIGRLAKLGIEATTNQACCVLPPSKKVSTEFLYYWLMCHRQEIIELSYGGGQPNISQATISKLKVSLPPKNEQKEIVDYLSRNNEILFTLKVESERSIFLLKERRAALISAAVTGKIDVREAT